MIESSVMLRAASRIHVALGKLGLMEHERLMPVELVALQNVSTDVVDATVWQ